MYRHHLHLAKSLESCMIFLEYSGNRFFEKFVVDWDDEQYNGIGNWGHLTIQKWFQCRNWSCYKGCLLNWQFSEIHRKLGGFTSLSLFKLVLVNISSEPPSGLVVQLLVLLISENNRFRQRLPLDRLFWLSTMFHCHTMIYQRFYGSYRLNLVLIQSIDQVKWKNCNSNCTSQLPLHFR